MGVPAKAAISPRLLLQWKWHGPLGKEIQTLLASHGRNHKRKLPPATDPLDSTILLHKWKRDRHLATAGRKVCSQSVGTTLRNCMKQNKADCVVPATAPSASCLLQDWVSSHLYELLPAEPTRTQEKMKLISSSLHTVYSLNQE